MHETAAFKFNSLPGWTFTVNRYLSPESDAYGSYATGNLRIYYHQDGEQRPTGFALDGPVGAPDTDRPFVPGGRVTFSFRSLPGYTFWATRLERQTTAPDRETGETVTVPEGWLRVGYTRDGEDDDVESCGTWGPRADGGIGPRLDESGSPIS